MEDAKDYSPSENITRVGIAFLADQSRKSMYKARSMRDAVSLSTKLYSELTGEEGLTPTPSPSGEGSSNTGSDNTGGNQGGNTGGNGGGGDEPGGDGNDQN